MIVDNMIEFEILSNMLLWFYMYIISSVKINFYCYLFVYCIC